MNTLDIARDLYGEDLQGVSSDLELDEISEEELDRMRETKALLDSRPRVRPELRTIDAVVSAARQAAAADGGAARPRLVLVSGLVRPLAFAAAACLVGVAGYWIGRQSASPALEGTAEISVQNPAARTRGAAPAPAEAPASLLVDAEKTELAGVEKAAEPGPAVGTADVAAAAAPNWDSPQDLLVIKWRVGDLEENLQGVAWDEAVPLGAMQPGEAGPYSGAAAAGDSSELRFPN